MGGGYNATMGSISLDITNNILTSLFYSEDSYGAPPTEAPAYDDYADYGGR